MTTECPSAADAHAQQAAPVGGRQTVQAHAQPNTVQLHAQPNTVLSCLLPLQCHELLTLVAHFGHQLVTHW